MKINAILILVIIFVISLLATPVQAISSYVEKCYWNENTMGNTEVMVVEIHNPSSKTEEFCIDCKIRVICVMPGTYEVEKESHWMTIDSNQIGPGEHITINFITRATKNLYLPSFCFVDTEGKQECKVKKCPACFIATAAYGTPTAEEIDVLRDFRDDVLMQSSLGKDLVEFYYAVSPPLANIISEHDLLRIFVRETTIDPIVWVISETEDYWRG